MQSSFMALTMFFTKLFFAGGAAVSAGAKPAVLLTRLWGCGAVALAPEGVSKNQGPECQVSRRANRHLRGGLRKDGARNTSDSFWQCLLGLSAHRVLKELGLGASRRQKTTEQATATEGLVPGIRGYPDLRLVGPNPLPTAKLPGCIWHLGLGLKLHVLTDFWSSLTHK